MVKNYKCQICETADFKYKCSACQVLYCSVPCYKVHKRTSCSAAGVTSSAPSVSMLQSDISSIQPARDKVQDNLDSAANSEMLRPLSSLRWPQEPETSMFVDPLTRDDPKPLNNAQYLSIATSPKLRSMLRENPRLPLLLRSLDSMHSSFARERHLEAILDVATGRVDPVPLENGESMDDDDVKIMRQFAEEVENAVRKPGDLGLAWEEPYQSK
ncbi:hypothetical protein CALVIDRAFT_538025 [Calocera viscosa TUFC12733]|uniref:HIT-type domain-containing protein n=1 Tax=Calocera viscosa (strain TUFC12733) TaxID=1330018 RepID=A0A167LF65_CALVF|nr:hypothetical protein CALVIDRAFT_538025 [Calocera viscosa TUFC12733]